MAGTWRKVLAALPPEIVGVVMALVEVKAGAWEQVGASPHLASRRAQAQGQESSIGLGPHLECRSEMEASKTQQLELEPLGWNLPAVVCRCLPGRRIWT